jgi:cytochrome c peroxidase
MATMMSCNSEEPTASNTLDDQLTELLSSVNNQGKEGFVLPNAEAYNSIPQDPKNPISKAKVALGKLLYHETGLGIKPQNMLTYKTYSCASCHSAAAGFQSGIRQGIGEGGYGYGLRGETRIKDPQCAESELDVQPLKSPSSLNSAFQEVMLWNGQFGATGINVGTEHRWNDGGPLSVNNLGYEGVETQAIAGFSVHRMGVDTTLLKREPYKSMFQKAFPGLTEDVLYAPQTIGLAIAAYERTLLSTEAPFQRWLNDEHTALTERQKQGALLFFGKAECVGCHNGPALNSMAFYAIGFEDLLGPDIINNDPSNAANKGRGAYTKNGTDDYKFKVPQLYNLKDAGFFGHGASFTRIEDVIRYKNSGQPENPRVPSVQLASEFKPLNLSEDEILALTDFVENALYDANLERYEPAKLPSGLCFPNNDMVSRNDRGCN